MAGDRARAGRYPDVNRPRPQRAKLDITAQPGNGNLLPALTGILNQNGLLAQLGSLASGLNQVAAALNAILGLLPTGPPTAAAAVSGR